MNVNVEEKYGLKRPRLKSGQYDKMLSIIKDLESDVKNLQQAKSWSLGKIQELEIEIVKFKTNELRIEDKFEEIQREKTKVLTSNLNRARTRNECDEKDINFLQSKLYSLFKTNPNDIDDVDFGPLPYSITTEIIGEDDCPKEIEVLSVRFCNGEVRIFKREGAMAGRFKISDGGKGLKFSENSRKSMVFGPQVEIELEQYRYRLIELKGPNDNSEVESQQERSD